MLIKSIPQNPKILGRDGTILKAAFAMISICIIYSVGTEFTFFFYSIKEILNAHWAISYPLAFLVSVAIIYGIESQGIKFASYAIDSILYQRWLANILFWFSALIAVSCYAASVFISIKGVPSIATSFVDVPTLSNTFNVDSTFRDEKKLILSSYSNDSLLIVSNFNNQTKSIIFAYKAKIEKQKSNVELYQRKQQRTGKSFKSKITFYKGKIQDLKAEKQLKVLEIQNKKGSALSELMKERKTNLSEIKDVQTTDKSKVESSNKTKSDKYDNKVESYSNGFEYGILVSVPVLIFCLFIIRKIYKDSGIKENEQFDDYFYKENVSDRFINLLRVKWFYFAHSRLDKSFNKIQPLEHVPTLNEIYKRDDLTKYIDPLKLDESQQNFNAVSASFPIGITNGSTVNKSNGKGVSILNGETVQNPNGKAYGKSNGKTVVTTTTTESVVSQKTKSSDKIKCLKKGCKKRFKPYPKSKRFCSTKCRVSHHNFELKK